jgi:hypothetical protein
MAFFAVADGGKLSATPKNAFIESRARRGGNRRNCRPPGPEQAADNQDEKEADRA